MLRLLEEIWIPKLGSFFCKIFFTLEIFLKDIHIFLWFIITPQSLLLLILMKCPICLKDLLSVAMCTELSVLQYWWSFFKSINNSRWKSSSLEVFCKKSVVKIFAKFTGKHLWLEPLFNKVDPWGLQSY